MENPQNDVTPRPAYGAEPADPHAAGYGGDWEASVGQQKRYSPEEIITMLREAEVRLGHGERVGGICDRFGISEQSYYRWRRQYGGLRLDQVKKIRRLEKENARLRRVLAAMAVSPHLSEGPE